MNPHIAASAPVYHTTEKKFDDMVRSFEQTLIGMSGKYDQIANLLNQSRLENATQHGEVEAELARLGQEVKGLRESTAAELKNIDQRISDVLKQALDDATEKLQRKNLIIRVLSYAIVGLLGMVAGDRVHLLAFVKELLSL